MIAEHKTWPADLPAMGGPILAVAGATILPKGFLPPFLHPPPYADRLHGDQQSQVECGQLPDLQRLAHGRGDLSSACAQGDSIT